MSYYLILHIKVVRGNIFLIVSTNIGTQILSKNSGSLGFKNRKKCSVESLQQLLDLGLNTILSKKVNAFFLKLEGIHFRNLREIYKSLFGFVKAKRLYLIGFKVINKIPHNGCRKKKIKS